MSIRKSAMGKPVDMNSLIAKNENVRAVGNMNVNARGDTIDSYGRVIHDKNKRINKMYNDTIDSRVYKPKDNNIRTPHKVKQQEPKQQELTAEEKEFEDQDEDFVKEEPKKGKK